MLLPDAYPIAPTLSIGPDHAAFNTRPPPHGSDLCQPCVEEEGRLSQGSAPRRVVHIGASSASDPPYRRVESAMSNARNRSDASHSPSPASEPSHQMLEISPTLRIHYRPRRIRHIVGSKSIHKPTLRIRCRSCRTRHIGEAFAIERCVSVPSGYRPTLNPPYRACERPRASP